jgi:hypothetical protein
MKKKDMIILGIIVGIAFFFIGAIISNVFPSSQTDLLPYKVSAVVKLLGLGVLTATMLAGGIIADDMEKNLRLLLLLLGLIFLVLYSIASPSLEWKLPSYSTGSPTGYESRPTGYGIPGFELIFFIAALIGSVVLIKIKKRTS